MASKENTFHSSKTQNMSNSTTFTQSSKKRNLSNIKTVSSFKPDLKISATPSPFRNDNVKLNDSKIQLESFEQIMNQEDFHMKLDKSLSNDNQNKKFFSKASLSTKNSDKSEKLATKMPNFIMNYDNLLSMITNDRNSVRGGKTNDKYFNSSKGSNVNKKSNTPTQNNSNLKCKLNNPFSLFNCSSTINTTNNYETPEVKKMFKKSNTSVQKEDHKSDSIHHLITSVKPKTSIKTEKEEEDRCIIIKSLTNTEEIKDFYENTEECLKRIAKLKVTPENEIQDLMVDLPFEREFIIEKKKLAVFDLDETIVHCEIRHPNRGEVQIQVKIPSGQYTTVGLNIRPQWRESLQEIKKNYVIIIYTASHQSYADSVLDYLDPNKEIFQYRLYRHNCVRVKMENDFIYVKDMRIFRNVPMKDLVIIDNSVLSFAFQLDNGIPILPYYNNKEDIELTFLNYYLNKIYKSDDLRVENRKSLKLEYFLQAAVDESSISESIDMMDEVDASLEKSDRTDTNNVGGLFSLASCNLTEESLDLSQSYYSNSINNSFVKDESSNTLNTYKSSSKITRFSPNGKAIEAKRKTSVLQGELINTLKGLKKSLEENLGIKKIKK